MKCGLCSQEIDEKKGRSTCDGCPFAKNCDMIKCPNCGFDNPVEPKWVERVKNFFKRRAKNATDGKS